jgi:hypothetical protein
MTLIGHFLTGRYVVQRTSKGTYNRGRYYPGPIETVHVRGSLQPSSARELKLPEEGNRIKQYWKFYSNEKLVVDSNATLAEGDIVTINSETYRAMAVTRWEHVDLPYYMTALWREPEQSGDAA